MTRHAHEHSQEATSACWPCGPMPGASSIGPSSQMLWEAKFPHILLRNSFENQSWCRVEGTPTVMGQLSALGIMFCTGGGEHEMSHDLVGFFEGDILVAPLASGCGR